MNDLPCFFTSFHEAVDSDEMVSDLNKQSNYRDCNGENHTKPCDDKHVLVQDVLTQLANKFMLIGDDVFDVLSGLVYFTERERWEKYIARFGCITKT